MTSQLFEEWRDINGYEESYQISNLGNFRSKTRTVVNALGVERTFKSRILAQSTTPSGYAKINLHKEGKSETRYTHRAVMESFVGECPEDMEVDHIDNDKSNNALTNLRYLSHAKNMERQDDFGTSVRSQAKRGEHYKQKSRVCSRGHLLAGKNLVMRSNQGSPYRACRSCTYTHSVVSQNPEMKPQFDDVANKRYAKIMGVTSGRD